FFRFSTYSSNALSPVLVILQVVKGRFPLNDFSIPIYPAFSSLSNWTLRLPAVDLVFSRRKVNSASSTLMSKDMTARRNWECKSGSSGLNTLTTIFFQIITGQKIAQNHRNSRNQVLGRHR